MGLATCRHLGAALCFLAALPAAEFTTYIGDVNDYHVARVAADSAGNTYLAGSRIVGALSEAVVMKLDPTGKIVLFTILSGKGSDAANGLALDAAGNIYIAGSTSSPDFPCTTHFNPRPAPAFWSNSAPMAASCSTPPTSRPPLPRWPWTPPAAST